MSDYEMFFADEEFYKSLVWQRLHESGWMDEIILICREKLMDRLTDGQTIGSINEIDLFNDMAPDARRKIPDSIKRELKVKVQNSLLEAAGYFDLVSSDSESEIALEL